MGHGFIFYSSIFFWQKLLTFFLPNLIFPGFSRREKNIALAHRPERNGGGDDDAAGMGRKKKKYEEELPWCFYCDREFNDEKILIQHQRAKVRVRERTSRHARSAFFVKSEQEGPKRSEDDVSKWEGGGGTT